MNQKIIVYYQRCICSSVDRAVASGAACVGSIPIRRILFFPKKSLQHITIYVPQGFLFIPDINPSFHFHQSTSGSGRLRS